MTRILVIEDSEPLRNDIIELLSFEGFTVIGAENGVVGVQKALEETPDLILCDIMMPEMDGYGVLETLKKDQRTVAVPFIFLSAKTDRSDIRHGMGLGADDYLTKPAGVADLLDAINTRLRKRATLEEMAAVKIRALSENIMTALPHELRTPLNTIMGFSEMLISESERLSPQMVKEWAQHINQAAQRLYRLVENYLMYVRANVAFHNPQEKAILRQRIAQHAGNLIEIHALQKADTFQRSADLELQVSEAVVQIAEQDLGKMIDELVDNAFKFSSSGIPVKVHAATQDGQYHIHVIDQGRGMSPDQIGNIGPYMQFERWFQEQQGSGLGLAIVRRFAEMYGGSLDIQSTVGQGTHMTLKLPLAQL